MEFKKLNSLIPVLTEIPCRLLINFYFGPPGLSHVPLPLYYYKQYLPACAAWMTTVVQTALHTKASYIAVIRAGTVLAAAKV